MDLLKRLKDMSFHKLLLRHKGVQILGYFLNIPPLTKFAVTWRVAVVTCEVKISYSINMGKVLPKQSKNAVENLEYLVIKHVYIYAYQICFLALAVRSVLIWVLCLTTFHTLVLSFLRHYINAFWVLTIEVLVICLLLNVTDEAGVTLRKKKKSWGQTLGSVKVKCQIILRHVFCRLS